MTLRLALIGGPMYDGLYAWLDGRDIEIVVHADHPTLNRVAAESLAAGDRIDVLSTHGKYVPSQARWLHPLDGLLDDSVLDGLAPDARRLCSIDGTLLCAPRMIDVRVLWARSDLISGPPDTWEDIRSLTRAGCAIGFPGRESGLFGTFFELVVGAGGHLLADGAPLDREAAEWAVATLVELAASAPSDLPTWHYDQVDAALLEGRVAMAAAWPGGAAAIRESGLPLEPHPYPAGAVCRVTYSGCHGWAIPRTCADLEAAVALVSELCSVNVQSLDVRSGAVCANTGAFSASDPVDDTDARRVVLTRDAIASQMITYPPLERFPDIEDAGWQAIRSALIGSSTPAEAVDQIDAAIRSVMDAA